MIDIRANFTKSHQKEKFLCICKNDENMKHIYECIELNSDPVKIEYNRLYNGSIHEQIEVMRRFENKNAKPPNRRESLRHSKALELLEKCISMPS